MKKYYFLILLFVFQLILSQSVFCQTKIDSLKSFIQTAEPSSAQLDALLELAELLMNTDNEENKIFLDKAEKLLNQFPDSLKKAELDKYYANYYSYKSEYDKATEYFLSAINAAENAGDFKLRNSAMNGLAILNIRTQNYKKGIEIFRVLLDYSINAGDKDKIIHYSLNLAIANGEAGAFSESEKYLLDVYRSNPSNKFYRAVASNGLSFIYNNNGEFQKALQYGKFAVDFSKNVEDAAFKIESLTNYSNALKGVGKNKEAGKIMAEIVELARKNNFKREMNNAIGNMALNYADMGNYKSAYKYYKMFSEKKDSLLNESTAEKINELQIKYETEKKDKEIYEKTASIKEKNIILFYTLIAVIFFVTVSIFVFVLYRKKNNAYKALVKKNLEIIKQEDEAVKSKIHPNEKTAKYGSSSLKDEKKNELIGKINSAVFEEKMFLQSDLTLGKLAQKLKSNSKYLSQVIHEEFNLGFSDFINQLRVKEAARLLNDESYRHFSFEGIAEFVGFNTKSSFNANFKKFTGVTPSFFSRASAEITELRG